MTEYTVEPEVAGGLGPTSIVDTSVHPPLVKRLEYEFSGWLGDDLVESFPCFLATQRLVDRLRASEISGYELDSVTVTMTPEFRERFDGALPEFSWLRITGRPGQEDLWVGEDLLLHTNDAGLAVLRECHMENAIIEEA